jgi:phenylalanyl-tRNA synthetase beta chain
VLAELEPGVARALGLEGELASDVALAEVALDVLLAVPERPPGYRPIPRYEGLKLDVAVLAPEELPAGELAQAIRGAGKGAVQSLELFDLYRGEHLGAGMKSLAWHVLLQSDQRTLSDQDGAKFLGRLARGLEPLGAELRSGGGVPK